MDSLFHSLKVISFFSGKFVQFPSNQTEPNQKRKKKINKIELLSNIMLEVMTNFVPVRLLQKPIRLTIKPIKKHNSHFINIYWKTCTLPHPLQSCLNNLFSKILLTHKQTQNNFHNFCHCFFFQRRR